ncbi:VCBS repeat-containing protein, partial [Streptomyces sp. NPDC046821]|uniref:FG-GAP repeat domain-containing protein n=1 Tax=Streptomyces sp. NPDC046821 TaxID=3154702 RepID=UPI0033D45202
VSPARSSPCVAGGVARGGGWRGGRAAAPRPAAAAGLSPLLPSASAADAPQETVVPATLRNAYTAASLASADTQTGADGAGAQGVFHRLEGRTTMVWTRYSDGTTVAAPSISGVLPSGTGSDILAYRGSDGRVDLWNAVDGTSRTLQVPQGQGLLNFYGDTGIAFRNVAAADGTTSRVMHLLTPGPDGTTNDVTVDGLPEGMSLGFSRGADSTSIFFQAKLGDTDRIVAVDRETGRAQSWTGALPSGYAYAKVSPDHVALYSLNSSKVLVVPRSDLTAAPTEVVLASGTGANPAAGLAVVGDWLVHRPSAGTAVLAKPIAGGASVTIGVSDPDVSVAPGGAALFIGTPTGGERGIQRVTEADGKPVVTTVKPLPKPPVPIQGLSLEQGRLVVADTGNNRDIRSGYLREVATAGTPEFGARSDFTGVSAVMADCPAKDAGCSEVHGTADGRIAWLERDTQSTGYDLLRVQGPTGTSYFSRSVPAGGRITSVSGKYVVYTAASQSYVYQLGNSGTPSVTRPAGAAALSGDLLWTAGTTPGSVTGYDLSAKKNVQSLTVDAPCVPDELQAVGRWLYWNCGADGKAGVYDRTAGKSVPVPSGEAELGDGFVVTHDKQAGELTLTTVTGGTAAGRVIGKLPDTGVSQRDVRWTVDTAGSNAAYVDAEERVHLVPSGVPTQPLSLLAPAENAKYVDATTFDVTPQTLTEVLLSKPSAKWLLTVRSKATGKVVDTEDGGPARGKLVVGWHGDDEKGSGDAFLPNGSYDWTLSVDPADGVGAPLQVRGSVALRSAGAVRHDHTGGEGRGPDGVADLLTLNSSGTLTFQQGDGKGAFAGKASGGGWTTSVTAVPFGDLNKDGCNDVLVRMKDGSLRGYKPKCGDPLTTSAAYTKLGTGWSAYNVLTSPGDLTGDRRADLLARKASTGDIYLFAAKSDGTLAAGKKIRSAWTTYTKIVGAGDLNGDGIGDVLARHKDGTLYRYDGAGNGTLKDRVKVFSAWGASYNAIVGVGDITGDGRSDLVERDGSGNLYRNDGKGNGSFGPRVKIASGWQSYKGLF